MTSMVIQTVSTVDAIEAQFRKNILDGAWAPGEKIPSEKELGNLLGVSRLPIREATARLKALGMFRSVQGKGVFVESRVRESGLSDALIPIFLEKPPHLYRQLVEARALLEGEIAALAANNGTEEEKEELSSFLDFPASAVTTATAFAEYDNAFHVHLAKMAKNDFLYFLFRSLCPYICKFLEEFGTSREVRSSALSRHEDLVDAVVKGQPERARRAAHSHLIPCLDTYFGKVER